MKSLSRAADLLATVGLLLIAAGLFLWHPFLTLLFIGALLVFVARLLVRQEEKVRMAREKE